MIKEFCDKCEQEITKENRPKEVTIYAKTHLTIIISINFSKMYNNGLPIHLCTNCIIDALIYNWKISLSS